MLDTLRSPDRFALRPSELADSAAGRFLVLCGLTGFAITQPLLSVLGEEPEFFTFRRASEAAIVVASLLIAVVPATLLWVIELAVGRLRPLAGWSVHLASVAGLATLAMVQVTKQSGIESPVAQVGLAAGLGLTGAVLYARFDIVTRWARYTAVLPVLAVGSFLLFSPVTVLFDTPVAAITSGSGTGTEPSVIILVLDELPTQSILDDERNIDAVRFPNLAAFSQDATWYRNHTTVATGTRQAIPALLTGREPEDLAPVLAEHPNNLFTLLSPTHDLQVSESMTNLCDFEGCGVADRPGLPEQVDRIVSGALDVLVDRLSPGPSDAVEYDDFAEVLAADVDLDEADEQLRVAPARFEEFLTTIEPTETPTLWYQHLLLPHQPWRTYSDGTLYDSETPPALGAGASWVRTLDQQRHLLQAQYTDSLLGTFLDQVRGADLYQDSLIVVVADHGIAFQEDANPRLWSNQAASEIAFAPLLVKAPGQTTGTIDDANVMGYDLLPTIGELVGVDIPWSVDGAPATSEVVAARDDQKVIFDFGAAMLPTDRTVNEFEASEHQPSADARWIRSRTPEEPRLSGLADAAGVSAWIGQELDDLVTETAWSAEIEHLDAIEDPQQDSRPAIVQGDLLGLPTAPGRILVAVDGIVVAGSPVILPWTGDPWFAALLPRAAFTDPDPSIRLAWVPGEDGTPGSGISEVTVRR